MDIITRQQAIEQGLKTYFENKSCKRGHVAPYRVNPNACTECIKAQKRKPQAELTACENCGKHFQPRITTRKVRFCSTECNSAFNNSRTSAARAAVKSEAEKLLQWLPGYMPRAKAKKLGLKTYFVGKRCPSGHVAPHFVAGGCTVCAIISSRKWQKAARLARPDYFRAKERARIRPRTDAVRRRESAYRQRTAMRLRKYRRDYFANRRLVDPCFRLRCDLTSLVGTAIAKQYGKKAHKTTDLIGCSIRELMIHLEAQFKDGMTWENKGRDGWHVDHIRPCASFDLTDPDQQRQCFHWSNLQPLWGIDNIRKGAKLLT